VQGKDECSFTDFTWNFTNCAAGTTGTLCGSCWEGYFKDGVHCRKCEHNADVQLGLLIAVVLVAAVVVALGAYMSKHIPVQLCKSMASVLS
jgi:hypothetical protein